RGVFVRRRRYRGSSRGDGGFGRRDRAPPLIARGGGAARARRARAAPRRVRRLGSPAGPRAHGLPPFAIWPRPLKESGSPVGALSLRRRQRLLRALARPPHGVFVRLLRARRRRSRYGAVREARPRLPKAAAPSGRAVSGHRLRLGRVA